MLHVNKELVVEMLLKLIHESLFSFMNQIVLQNCRSLHSGLG